MKQLEALKAAQAAGANYKGVIRDAYQRNLGLLLVIGSQIFLSLVNVAVQKASRDRPARISPRGVYWWILRMRNI